MKSALTQERLKEFLHYDSQTGIFTRKQATYQNTALVGAVAGCKKPKRYRSITVDNQSYLCHRLAWLYVHGYFPEGLVEHIDRIKYHNWISNLREASVVCNSRNVGNWSTNTTGVKGVHWDCKNNKWMAKIMVYKRSINLGRYNDFNNAVCARLAAEQCLNWEGCDSCSPAYQYVQKMLKESK